MASQGPNSPGTMADDATVGTLGWLNVDNAKISDNIYATRNLNQNIVSHYLKSNNFGFSIPLNSNINGIVVEVEKKSDNRVIIDNAVRIIKNNNIGATDKSDTTYFLSWDDDESYHLYGSPSDLWGETWSVSDINNSNFGFAISATNWGIANDTASVDHIRVTVYYTEIPPSTISNISSMTGVQSITL